MKTHLWIGGLVAVGFDESGRYLLTISHSGRGVFSTTTWQRIAHDYAIAYPNDGFGIGIGPMSEQIISVTEMDYEKGMMSVTSPDGRITLNCESSGISVEVTE